MLFDNKIHFNIYDLAI